MRASLPVNTGVILDPFMGSGSTIAAAESLGLNSVGVERYSDYFEMGKTTIPRLARISIDQPLIEQLSDEQPSLLDISDL